MAAEQNAERNKELVRRFWEAWNQGNALELMDTIFDPDFVLHSLSQSQPLRGLSAVREGITAPTLAAFPQGHFTVEDLIAEGDKAVYRVTVRTTHEGPFRGVPPTGKAVVITGMGIQRFAGGKIVEEWQLFDTLSVLQQIGAVSIPAGGSE